MLVGYARVSTQDQNLELQRDALTKAGVERTFEDKMSGAKAERPGLMEALNFMRPGDTLVVWKLSRLGRSVKNVIETVEMMQRRGVELKCLSDSIDTNTAQGRFFFIITAAFAQLERETMIENTKAGLAAARARGRKGGRPRVLDAKRIEMARELAKDKSRPVKEICSLLKISRATFYNYLKEECAGRSSEDSKPL